MSVITTIEARARAFYDGIAEDYDRQMDTPEVRAMRECFWHRAEAALTEPARILDFGAGSGLDARHFAGLGHDVTAYDLSEGMLKILQRRCAAHITAGSIVPIAGTLDEARPDLAAQAPFDMVLCNFAVFSMIPRLDGLFRLFAELVRPGGAVLISIQNPWHREETRTRSFWRALLALPFTRVIRYRSAQSEYSFRHTPGQVRRAARPGFVPDMDPAPACCWSCFGPRSKMRLVALRRR